MALVSLITDFGTQDWFVGVMKGLILRAAPETRLIDLTHEIPPGDIRAGAFALMASCRFLPRGSVHLVVVDPGVGSSRRGLAVQTEEYSFVAPDNGVLSWALRNQRLRTIHALENPAYRLEPVSNTFHGRDIFAPVAAHLSRGGSVEELGPEIKEILQIAWPEPRLELDRMTGEILYVDRFGNAISNLDSASLGTLGPKRLIVRAHKVRACPIATYYQAVPAGEAVAVLGSSGFLEIAVNGGNAAQRLGLKPGDPIAVQRQG
jgi:S-adenosyl-L-methionine hydrolase (adenosine-forming)